MLRRYLETRRDIFSRPRRHFDEEPVRNHLSLSPAQMMEMAEKGIPIAAQNVGLSYDEGVSKLDFEPPLEYRRGVDIGDMWECREDVRHKLLVAKQSGKLQSQPADKVE